MTCGLRKEVIMRKQTRHRFVATNYNRDERHLPFLLYNFYFMRFAQRRKGKLAKTKIFLSLTSGVCFIALIFENYHTIPLAQNEIHLQLQLKSPIQDDGALVLYIRATLTFSPRLKQGGFLHQPPLRSNRSCCVLHDVRQALLPVCPTVRYVLV